MEKSRGQNPQEKGLNRALAEEKTWKKKKKNVKIILSKM